MFKNPEQAPQRESNEVVKIAFRALEQKMSGQDLVFRDKASIRRFYVIANPAGTISLHDCSTGYDHILWADGTVETIDPSDIDGTPVKTIGVQELESILKEMQDLKEEKMEHLENI